MSTAAPARHAELPPFFRAHRFETLVSTSDEAKRMAAAGAPEGTLVLACRQTGGRGRRGRRWHSPEGNFHCSFLLRPACPAPAAAQLSFVAAVAVAQALTAWLAAERIRLKWPNDVLADGAKLAGILAESASVADARVTWLVLGIGVNLAHCPAGLDHAATSLSELGQDGVSPEAMLGTLAPALLDWYRRWRQDGFGPVRDAWLAHAAGLRQPVHALTPAGFVDGIFEDLDPAGALVLVMPDGGRRRVEAGEVQF